MIKQEKIMKNIKQDEKMTVTSQLNEETIRNNK